MNDFTKFSLDKGVRHSSLDSYTKTINGIISPTIVEERQLNAVTMDVFSRLMSERIIFLGTVIDSDVANIVNSQLMYLNSIDQESDIKMFVNSPGGVIDDGLAIYDVMNWVNCDVATYTMGMAASMGAILASSGTKGKRYALPHSKIMIHQPMGGLRPGTQESDFKIAYDEIKKDKQLLYEILAENTGKSVKEITKASDRDCWFTAKEALEYGLIDEIILKKK